MAYVFATQAKQTQEVTNCMIQMLLTVSCVLGDEPNALYDQFSSKLRTCSNSIEAERVVRQFSVDSESVRKLLRGLPANDPVPEDCVLLMYGSVSRLNREIRIRFHRPLAEELLLRQSLARKLVQAELAIRASFMSPDASKVHMYFSFFEGKDYFEPPREEKWLENESRRIYLERQRSPGFWPDEDIIALFIRWEMCGRPIDIAGMNRENFLIHRQRFTKWWFAHRDRLVFDSDLQRLRIGSDKELEHQKQTLPIPDPMEPEYKNKGYGLDNGVTSIFIKRQPIPPHYRKFVER